MKIKRKREIKQKQKYYEIYESSDEKIKLSQNEDLKICLKFT